MSIKLTPIKELGLTARIEGVLKAEGILTLESLVERSMRELLRMPGLGKLGLREVSDTLAARGIVLQERCAAIRHDLTPAPDTASTLPADPAVALRDYFATKAMQGMFANDALISRYGESSKDNHISPDVLLATAAYSIADAMLATRSA